MKAGRGEGGTGLTQTAEVGGLLSTITPPTSNPPLLLRTSVLTFIPKLSHAGWSDLDVSACSE